MSAFACMGIESAHTEAWVKHAKLFSQGVGYHFDGEGHAALCNALGN